MFDNTHWKSNVIRFLTAQTVSLLGSSLVQFAIIWHITLSTASGSMLTLSTVCGFLPQIFLALFAGSWLDRFDRKKMIMLADGVIALATLALALAFLSGNGSVWLLFAVLIVRSAGTGVQTPAVNAFIPQIVPPEHLMRINSLNSSLNSLTVFLSPAVSGAVLAAAGLEATLFVDVVTAIIGIGITVTVRAQPYKRETEEEAEAAKAAGVPGAHAGLFAFLRQNRFVLRLLAYQVTIMFLVCPAAFLTPLLLTRTYGPEVWRLTVGEMSYSLGMTLGGLLLAAWGGFKRRLDTTVLAGMGYGFIMIGLGLAPTFVVYIVLNTLIGVTTPLYNTPITVSIQERVDASMHGRVFSLMQIGTCCALPLGMVLFGPLADMVPVQWVLIAGGCVILPLSLLVRLTGFIDR